MLSYVNIANSKLKHKSARLLAQRRVGFCARRSAPASAGNQMPATGAQAQASKA
jgi:hypothetical protein